MIQDVKYKCCFCNTIIESNEVDPCDLNILINIDKSKEEQENQTFYCHVTCFRKRLHGIAEKWLIVDLLEN